MEIRVPAPVERIIGQLNEHGYEAYIVGGCVRDMLLNREPGTGTSPPAPCRGR